MSNFDRKEFGRNIRKFRKAKDLMDQAYDMDFSEGEYLQDCVSRKKNVVPVLMSSFEK